MSDENGNGQKRRVLDQKAMERAAENSVVKLAARLAWVIIISLGGYFGHRMVTQMDTISAAQTTLLTTQITQAKDIEVIAVEIKGIDRRVRTLERPMMWRRGDMNDDRPGVRQ